MFDTQKNPAPLSKGGVEVDADEVDVRMHCGNQAEVDPLAAAELEVAQLAIGQQAGRRSAFDQGAQVQPSRVLLAVVAVGVAEVGVVAVVPGHGRKCP